METTVAVMNDKTAHNDDDDHQDEEVRLEDAAIEKDTADNSTVQQKQPEKIQNDGDNSSSNTRPVSLQQQHQHQHQQKKEDQNLY